MITGDAIIFFALVGVASIFAIAEYVVKEGYLLGMLSGLFFIMAGASGLYTSTGYNSLMYWVGIGTILVGITVAAGNGISLNSNNKRKRTEYEQEHRTLSFDEIIRNQMQEADNNMQDKLAKIRKDKQINNRINKAARHYMNDDN